MYLSDDTHRLLWKEYRDIIDIKNKLKYTIFENSNRNIHQKHIGCNKNSNEIILNRIILNINYNNGNCSQKHPHEPAPGGF